jgi:hypothetical protein
MHDHHDHNDDCNITHPRDRAPQAGDPMEISGIEVEGDPQVMLECIIEEYARMGADADAIMRMFNDPYFQGPHGLTRVYGRQFIRYRVEQILDRCGVLRVSMSEEAAAPDGESVALTVAGRTIAERK